MTFVVTWWNYIRLFLKYPKMKFGHFTPVLIRVPFPSAEFLKLQMAAIFLKELNQSYKLDEWLLPHNLCNTWCILALIFMILDHLVTLVTSRHWWFRRQYLLTKVYIDMKNEDDIFKLYKTNSYVTQLSQNIQFYLTVYYFSLDT